MASMGNLVHMPASSQNLAIAAACEIARVEKNSEVAPTKMVPAIVRLFIVIPNQVAMMKEVSFTSFLKLCKDA